MAAALERYGMLFLFSLVLTLAHGLPGGGRGPDTVANRVIGGDLGDPPRHLLDHPFHPYSQFTIEPRTSILSARKVLALDRALLGDRGFSIPGGAAS